MDIPYLPTIPTDSLHRFCAITGLLLMVVPPAYLELRSELYAKEAIHLKAERKIMGLNTKEMILQKDVFILEAYHPQMSDKDDRRRSQYLDSIVKTGLPIKMRSDSAKSTAMRIAKLVIAQQSAIVRLEENGELLNASEDLTRRYIVQAALLGFTGFGMALYGFKTWHRKENAVILNIKD